MSDVQTGQNTAEETASSMPDENKSAEDTQPTLPDSVSERTASEFEKLKARNKQLAEENAKLTGSQNQKGSVLDEIRPQFAAESPTNQSAPAVADNFVDDGGYVDTALLNATLTQARQQAEDARRIAAQNQEAIQNFQETEQVRKAHAAYPQLDPNNNDFDPRFYNMVKNELIGQLMTGNQDIMDAAGKVSGYYQAPAAAQAKAEQQKQTISQREQASAATGASKGQRVAKTQEDLVAGTIKGDKEAIGLRLQASGY